jgi:hypothetical protein
MIWYILAIACAITSILTADLGLLALGLIFSVVGTIRERQ